MSDILAAEIEGIVDKQLQDCGFIDLCTRIAQKVVEKVQKIEEDHGMLKSELNGIEEKLNVILNDRIPPENKPAPVKKDVIVIEEEEEDNKPLVAKLHEITKSSQMLSYNAEYASPPKQLSKSLEVAEVTSTHAPNRETRTVSNSRQRTPLSRQYAGAKRNAVGTVVSSGIEKDKEQDLITIVSNSSVQQSQQTGEQKGTLEAGEVVDLVASEGSPKSPVIKSDAKDKGGHTPSKSPVGTPSKNQKEVNDDAVVESITSDEVKPDPNEKSGFEAEGGDCSVVPDNVNDAETEMQSSSNVLLPEEHLEDAKVEDKDAENQESVACESYEYEEGHRVLGKPDKSDIWYTARISKIIINKYNQKKYQVKFESGLKIHGTLPGNSLAPILHPKPCEVNIGSRVAAIRPRDTVDARIQKKYMNFYSSDFAKGEILFGGIVVERSCEENRHRFLVVFDDGFAQYMTEKKMHLVIHSAENVWQDVSVHCREFIKEYLEEYPKRPMLKVKPGLSIQTEWNGKWLQAKVIAVDCSLVKMLFDVDKRTEWIYRGSTRLEPLYSELERRDLEALRTKNRKSNKKKRLSSVKKVEPYVEDAITKPCFGISKFSKTDPKGIQQIKEWGPVVGKPPGTLQDDSMPSDSDSVTDSPVKLTCDEVLTDNRATSSMSRKRKLDAISPESSSDTVNIDSEVGPDRTPSTKDVTTGQSMASQMAASPRNSPARGPIRRSSSQSSIDSTASDSQLLLRSRKHGRLERQLSNHSIQSNQSDRTDLQARGVGQARPKSSSFDIPSSPGSPKSTQKIVIARSSASKQKISVERNSSIRPVQRLILPRPTLQQQQHLQFWRIPDGAGAFPLPHVFIPKLAINQLSLSRVQFQPQITGNVITLGTLAQSFPKIKGPHDCSKSCVLHVRLPPGEKQKHNPLSIPLILGWTRETAKRRPGYHRDIYYRAPCSRRLRNMAEVSKFLLRTDATNVTIDQFSFDSSVSCRDQIPVFRLPYLRIDDISYGKEEIPISCVNEKSDERPPNVEYISNRIIGHGININTDRGFLACCDCTDNCQDKTKCACVRLTVDSSDAIDGKKDAHSGYHYRRLKECVTTGIYECNQNCSCSSTCYNRVVQNGIAVRLQVFMTDTKGWGIRCLDDIPRGAFICTYSGQILNEEMADKEGTDYGDEYLAELDHIEIVEKAKEGYESDVPELRGGKKPQRNRSFESSSKGYDSSDSDDSDFEYSTSPESTDDLLANVSSFKELERAVNKSQREKKETRNCNADNIIDLTLESDPETENGTEIANGRLEEDTSSVGRKFSSSSFEYMIKRLKNGANNEKQSKCEQLSPEKDGRSAGDDSTKREKKFKSPSPKFYIEMDTSDGVLQDEDSMLKEGKNETEANLSETESHVVVETNCAIKPGLRSVVSSENLRNKTNQLSEENKFDEQKSRNKMTDWNIKVKKAIEMIGPTIRKAVAKKTTRSILFQRLANTKRSHCDDDGVDDDDDDDVDNGNRGPAPIVKNDIDVSLAHGVLETVVNSELNPGKTFTSPRSSTGGHFARKALKLQVTPPGQQLRANEQQNQQLKDASAIKSTRHFFGEDQCYVIDAKSFGNIGRFLNHSCMPNLFVQNVFIDTHDLRFPFVAFFAQQNIPALSELTWDYSYEVGSVPGKVLQCYCGALECRGRLL